VADRDVEALMRAAILTSTMLVMLAAVASLPVAAAHPHDDGDELDEPEPIEDDASARPPSPPSVALAPGSAPAIAAVLEAAYAAAGLDRDLSRSWTRRARLAGLVPWLSVRTGWDASWDDQTPEIDRGRTFEVRATWRLDRLVFDGRELQAASVEAARRRERRRLAAQVIQLYFAWQRAAASAMRDSRSSWRRDELAAQLDALTDGWFSTELRGAMPSRRTASEIRTP